MHLLIVQSHFDRLRIQFLPLELPMCTSRMQHQDVRLTLRSRRLDLQLCSFRRRFD